PEVVALGDVRVGQPVAAGEYGYVLLAVDLVADRTGVHACAGLKAPQLFARGVVHRHEQTVRPALEHHSTGRRENAVAVSQRPVTVDAPGECGRPWVHGGDAARE